MNDHLSSGEEDFRERRNHSASSDDGLNTPPAEEHQSPPPGDLLRCGDLTFRKVAEPVTTDNCYLESELEDQFLRNQPYVSQALHFSPLLNQRPVEVRMPTSQHS